MHVQCGREPLTISEVADAFSQFLRSHGVLCTNSASSVTALPCHPAPPPQAQLTIQHPTEGLLIHCHFLARVLRGGLGGLQFARHISPVVSSDANEGHSCSNGRGWQLLTAFATAHQGGQVRLLAYHSQPIPKFPLNQYIICVKTRTTAAKQKLDERPSMTAASKRSRHLPTFLKLAPMTMVLYPNFL